MTAIDEAFDRFWSEDRDTDTRRGDLEQFFFRTFKAGFDEGYKKACESAANE